MIRHSLLAVQRTNVSSAFFRPREYQVVIPDRKKNTDTEKKEMYWIVSPSYRIPFQWSISTARMARNLAQSIHTTLFFSVFGIFQKMLLFPEPLSRISSHTIPRHTAGKRLRGLSSAAHAAQLPDGFPLFSRTFSTGSSIASAQFPVCLLYTSRCV